MTSRSDRWLRESDDQLDVLIRCAVRERVAEAAPSRRNWERVVAATRYSLALRQAWSRLGIQLEAIGMYLAGEDSGLPARDARARPPGGGAPRAYDLHWTRLDRHQAMRLVA